VTLPVCFAPDATADVLVACHWLDGVRFGLGDEFLADIDRLAAAISQNPATYETAYRNCRRAVLRRFDYVLAYRVLADRIEVLGLLHCRLDPAIAANRSTAAR
jgi:hypothetical protein